MASNHGKVIKRVRFQDTSSSTAIVETTRESSSMETKSQTPADNQVHDQQSILSGPPDPDADSAKDLAEMEEAELEELATMKVFAKARVQNTSKQMISQAVEWHKDRFRAVEFRHNNLEKINASFEEIQRKIKVLLDVVQDDIESIDRSQKVNMLASYYATRCLHHQRAVPALSPEEQKYEDEQSIKLYRWVASLKDNIREQILVHYVNSLDSINVAMVNSVEMLAHEVFDYKAPKALGDHLQEVLLIRARFVIEYPVPESLPSYLNEVKHIAVTIHELVDTKGHGRKKKHVFKSIFNDLLNLDPDSLVIILCLDEMGALEKGMPALKSWEPVIKRIMKRRVKPIWWRLVFVLGDKSHSVTTMEPEALQDLAVILVSKAAAYPHAGLLLSHLSAIENAISPCLMAYNKDLKHRLLLPSITELDAAAHHSTL